MEKRKIFKVLPYLLCLFINGCVPAVISAAPPASTAPADWRDNYADVRQAWFTYFDVPANGLRVKQWRLHENQAPADYLNIVRRYEWAVYWSWKVRGELHYIVVDEDGELVDDATREVREFVKLGSDLEPRFHVKTQPVFGMQTIKLEKNMFGYEEELQSTGHRWVRFRLPSNDIAAHEALEAGLVLPPLTPDGPVRIVMPFRYTWPDGKDGPNMSVLPNNKPDLNKNIPLDRPTVVSTNEIGARPAPKRGVYAFIDCHGKVFAYYQFDAGCLLGVEAAGDYGQSHGEKWALSVKGNEDGVPGGNEPYAWVLVAEPMRRSPDEVSAERAPLIRRSKQSTTQPTTRR